MSEIDEIYARVFGETPAKRGTAYERLAAIVMATLGWSDVAHDRRLTGDGRLAAHQIDVTARDPAGAIRRMVIECKEWNTLVGQPTLDALASVRRQVGADAAAAMTTEGYSRGARAVAVDEDIALLVLRPYDPARDNFVLRVVIEWNILVPAFSDFDVEFLEDEPARTVAIRMTAAERLLTLAGDPAERLIDVMEANAAPLEEGVFRRRAELPDGRLVPLAGGGHVGIRALTWTETNHASRETQVIEGRGTPLLVFQQLEADGSVHSGRLILDSDLVAWRIGDSGEVVERRAL